MSLLRVSICDVMRGMRIFFLVLLLFPFIAKSQVFTPTIASATGGAGRAAVDGGESAYLNPASTADLSQYYISANYQRGEHPNIGDYGRYAFAIADGTTSNILPGAFSYYHQTIDFPDGRGRRTDTDYQLSFAGFVASRVSLGVAGHYYTNAGQGRDNAQTQANVGLLWSPIDTFGVGVVGYDLLPASTDVTADRRLTANYAVGVHYIFSELLRLRLDLVRPDIQPWADRRTDVMMGLESYFASMFIFRLGAQAYETLNQTNLTAGFAYHGPRLSLDYSFQKDIRSAGGIRHSVDLWMPL